MIHNKLKSARELLKLTQKEIAEKTGLDQSDVSRLENGKCVFIPNEYMKFLHINNIDINSIYNDDKNVNFYTQLNTQLYTQLSPPKPENEVQVSLPSEPLNPEALKFGSPMPEIHVVTVDSTGRNNIVLVDSKAAAGLPYHVSEPAYYKGLPAFTLPGIQYQQGHFIAIEIAGDSMHPTILHGDYLIAKELEHVSEIKSGSVYVVVTKEGVICKRLNYANSAPYVECISDNEVYLPYHEPLENVLRIYCVHNRLSSQLRNYNSDVRRDITDTRKDITELKSEIYNIKALLNKKL